MEQTTASPSPVQMIMPGAQPYFQRGGKVGCVCLHGFTASPHEVLWLGQHLAAQGHTVYVPRLAGHGTNPADLARCEWSDWLNSTLDAYHVIRQQCEQVFLCGLSMGGVLALLASTIVPVDGVVVMGSPLVLGGEFTPQALSQIKLIQPMFDSTDTSPFADYIREQQMKRGEPVLGRVRYNTWYTAAVEQLALLIEVTQGQLVRVQTPILALYSENDKTVGLHNQQYLLEHVGSAQVESHTFQHSGHILTQDIEHPEVFRRAAAFIARYAHP